MTFSFLAPRTPLRLLLHEYSTCMHPSHNYPLSNPLVVTIATNKDQSQSIIPNITSITLKEHCLIMATFITMSILTPRKGWIITDCRWNGVEDVAHFLLENVLVD